MTATTRNETNAGPDSTLTVREAADAAGVSEATIRRRIKDGIIEGAAPDADGTWRVPSAQLDNVRVRRRPAAPRPSRTPATFSDIEVVELRGKLAVEQTRRAAAEQLASEREQTISTLRRALDLLEHDAAAAPTKVKSGRRAGKQGSDGSGGDLAVASLVQTDALEPLGDMKPVKSAKPTKPAKSKKSDDDSDEKKSDKKKSGKGKAKKKRDKEKPVTGKKPDTRKADKKSG